MYGRGQQTVSFGPPVTPDVIKYLLIANVAALILELQVFDTRWTIDTFGVVPALFWQKGFIWQPFTYMWLHSPGLMHIGFNMLALWMFGSPLAMVWGEKRFLRFYLLSGVGAGFLIALWPQLLYLSGVPMYSYVAPTIGASGAVFAVLLAYSLTWPDRTIMLLFPPIPIKAIYFIPFIFAMTLLFPGGGNISHVGHIGGVIVGWILFRRMAGAPLLPSRRQLTHRYRRWKMRRNLRAVRMDDERRFRQRNDDDWRVH